MSLKRALLLAAICLTCGASGAHAQRSIEITPFGGTRFGGQVDVNTANVDFLRIKSTVDYGGLFDVDLASHLQAEFMWNRQPTVLAEHDVNSGAFTDLTKAKLDQYQFSLLYEFPGKRDISRIRPFIVGGMGFTNFHSNGVLPFDNRFGWNLGGGVKYFLTRNVGLRIESRWTPTQTTSSIAQFCDPFFGCFPARVRNYAQQGEANVGLIFRF
jgi:opacity protein-like surface antigen